MANPRPLDLDSVQLYAGSHAQNDQQLMCVMEAVAFVAGERWSDHPRCASKVIGVFLRSWNDAMSDEDRQMLKPLIPRLVGTAASAEVELRRSWMALDWSCRVSAPAWLRLAGLASEAEALEALPEITDTASARTAQAAPTTEAGAPALSWPTTTDQPGRRQPRLMPALTQALTKWSRAMTETVRCRCGHPCASHDGVGRCMLMSCLCLSYAGGAPCAATAPAYAADYREPCYRAAGHDGMHRNAGRQWEARRG